MNNLRTIFSAANRILGLVLAVALITSCTDDETLTETVENDPTPVAQFIEESDVASVTVSGLFTEVTDNLACETCSYRVADNVTSVDGLALGLKPGSVVCISGSRKLGDVEFVNMLGTEESPIIIGTCDND